MFKIIPMTLKGSTHYHGGNEFCLWGLLQIRKGTKLVSIVLYCVLNLTAPSWGDCEGELGDCGVHSMLAPRPQLQASGPLPFTFCPGNEAGCLHTFGCQLLHMGCEQHVCVFVSSRIQAPDRPPVHCVFECVCSWISSTVLNLDFLSTDRRSMWGFVCNLRSSGRSGQLSPLDLLTRVCQLYQAGIITAEQYCVY